MAGATRTVSPEVTAFAEAQKLTLADSFEALLADPTRRRGRAGDAALACTPSR